MKSRVSVLIVIACLVLTFIAYEVFSVASALKQGGVALGDSGGGFTPSGGQGGPVPPEMGKPTVPYPDLCHALVELDKSPRFKLTAAQKKQALPLLEGLRRTSEREHAAERELFGLLDARQRKWVQAHRDELMQASVQPGEPPISYALYYFKGIKGVKGGQGRERHTARSEPSLPPDSAPESPPAGASPTAK